jgi:hypothetical protein
MMELKQLSVRTLIKFQHSQRVCWLFVFAVDDKTAAATAAPKHEEA